MTVNCRSQKDIDVLSAVNDKASLGNSVAKEAKHKAAHNSFAIPPKANAHIQNAIKKIKKLLKERCNSDLTMKTSIMLKDGLRESVGSG